MLGAYLTLIDNESDKKLFEAFYTGYKSMMYNVAFDIIHDVHLAEDAVMNSFFILARNMEKVSDRTMSEVRNFLVVVVRNQAIKIYNKHKSITYCEDELDALPDDTDMVYELENKELQNKVFGMIKELDKDCSDMEELQREPFDTYLFNWMDELEFRDYLVRRYGNRFSFQERTIYYYTRKEEKK